MFETKTIEERVKQIFAAVLHMKTSDDILNATYDSLKQWDSIGHLCLFMALEEEFDFEFSPNQIVELKNFRSICETVKQLKRS